MKALLSNSQTLAASWALTSMRWVFVGLHIYYVRKAAEYFDYKIGVGDLSKAEPLNQLSGVMFWLWASLVLVAIVVALISPKTERSIIVLLQVVVLPSLELLFMLFMDVGS